MKNLFFITLFTCCFINSVHSKSYSCSSQFQKAVSTALDLTYEEYDQTPGQGLRSFDINCQYEGALVTIYYLSRKEKLTKSQRKNLSFHIGQALASSGHDKDSIEYFTNAKYIKNPSELLWNEYIDGTVAFLNKDLLTLEKNLYLLEDHKNTHFGNELNLKVLKRLIVGLKKGQSYQDIDWALEK